MEYISAWKIQNKKELEEIYDFYYNFKSQYSINHNLPKEEWCEYYKNLSILKFTIEKKINDDFDFLLSCVTDKIVSYTTHGNQLKVLSILILAKDDNQPTFYDLGNFFRHEIYSGIKESYWNIAVCPELEEPIQIRVVAGFYEAKMEEICAKLKENKEPLGEIINLPIEELDFSVRVQNACKNAGLETLFDVISLSDKKDFLDIMPCYTDEKIANLLERELNALSMTFEMSMRDIVNCVFWWQSRIE